MTQLTHYLEIKAIPQTEMTQTMVINHLMQSLHSILPAYQGKVGLSFPAYGQLNTLGGILRLFGSETDIQQLHKQILQSHHFTDYAFITSIIEVPQTTNQYLCFSRIQVKGNSDRKRIEKRLTAQGKWNETILEKVIEKWGSKRLKLPHVHLKSSSNKQSFIIWIKKQSRDNPIDGVFNSYGLSQQATVPSF